MLTLAVTEEASRRAECPGFIPGIVTLVATEEALQTLRCPGACPGYRKANGAKEPGQAPGLPPNVVYQHFRAEARQERRPSLAASAVECLGRPGCPGVRSSWSFAPWGNLRANGALLPFVGSNERNHPRNKSGAFCAQEASL